MTLLALSSLLLSAADGGVAAAPADFIDDARVVYRLVACAGDPLPAGLDPATVERFCAIQKPRYARYMEHWGTVAKDFLARLRGAGAPSEAVYLFGGGDLMSALTAYPDAPVITTVSLELAGDPRRAAKLTDAAALRTSLNAVASASMSTLLSNDSLSKNLSRVQRGQLPGQLAMHFMGLAMFGLEPVAVRYFHIEPDGRLRYLTAADVAELEDETARSLNAGWRDPDFSPAFANVEVEYAPRGQPGPRRIHRHIAADLSNLGLTTTAPGVLAHLNLKSRVTAITKAASYLLWGDDFSLARGYLTGHAAYMVSDSTGPPPRYWRKAGCTVETYGSFRKSFLDAWEGYQAELRKEFAAARPLPMRFGYPDGSPEKRSHLVVARCPASTDGGVPASSL